MKIVFCGSCTFVYDMKKAADYLAEKGHECFLPTPLITEEEYESQNSKEKKIKMKPFWTKRHCDKIKESDAVLIFNREKKNIKGYFGSNTLMELSVAFYLGKKIFFLNNIHEDHPHYEEIIGMESVVLNENLEKVK